MLMEHDKDATAGCCPARLACQECSLHRLCLPLGVERADLERLERIVSRRRPPLRRGDYLFHAGDSFRTVYVIRTGSVKTFTCSRDGEEHVTGFYLPGELIGLDAIAASGHPCAARALETTTVCEIRYEDLEALSGKIPGLQRQLLRLMSCEIVRDQNMMVVLGRMPAEERLATLLLNIAGRFEQRGFSGRQFRLSMSRHDIGSYLGLALETVSRLFSRLQADGLIGVQRKQVQILDREGLLRRAGPALEFSA